MDDKKLIELIKQSPSIGLKIAIEEYGGLVKTIVSRILGFQNQRDIEECVSDVFVELWKSVDKFNPDKGLLKNYIISIARHMGINTYNRKIIKYEIIPLEENDLEIDIDLDNEVSSTINKEIIIETINSLPYPDKEIFIRRYYLFEPIKEIAISLNINAKAVENKLFRGKDKLKAALINKGIIL